MSIKRPIAVGSVLRLREVGEWLSIACHIGNYPCRARTMGSKRSPLARRPADLSHHALAFENPARRMPSESAKRHGYFNSTLAVLGDKRR